MWHDQRGLKSNPSAPREKFPRHGHWTRHGRAAVHECPVHMCGTVRYLAALLKFEDFNSEAFPL